MVDGSHAMTDSLSKQSLPQIHSSHSTISLNTTILSSPPPHVPLSPLKENTLVSRNNMASPSSLKRKLSDRDDPTPSPPKKPRISLPSVTITLKPTKQKPFASAPIPMPNACPDYPNGFIYCHQCSKKRDVTDAIQCTFLELPQSKEKDPEKDNSKEKEREKLPRQRRCVAKFCKFCLKNRYDQEFDDVVNTARSRKNQPSHIDTAGYIYKCPKCSDTCNCPRCRKSKGLEPMGSAGTIRRPPPEPIPKPTAAAKSKADRKSKKQANGDSASTAKGGKAAKKPKAKPLPIVKWTSLPVCLSLEDAEARFHIREFVLRFADLFEPSLPRTSLEELEEIGGGRHQGRDEDDEMASWVSEFCVKSIIVGLLNLLAKELQGSLATAIKSAVKEIRNVGVNLNKIWPVLTTLRDSPPAPDPLLNLPPSTLPGSPSPFTFTFPDPLPPPSSHDIRAIRSTRTNAANDGSNIHIAYSAQMIPVVESLIEDALLTGAVREELEAGMREGLKETIKEQKEAIKREAERWEVVRKGMETRVKLKAQILENRAKREYHKLKLISLENSLRILSPKYVPRLTPLGTDADGRVYWILSPGVSEREAAQDFILSCSNDDKLVKSSKKKILPKKAKVLTAEERVEMRSWSWFVAVWGRKPEEAAGSVKANRNGNMKLKIKVNARKPKVKAKEHKRGSDDEMEVDGEEHADREDVEMGSGSDSERGPSTSQSDSGSDESDNDNDNDNDNDSQSSSAEEEDREKWWGFYDPLEILKLSDWIAMKTGLDDESSDPLTTIPLPSQHNHTSDKDKEKEEQNNSRASSSTATLTNGSSSVSHTNGAGKSRDTSVTVVDSSFTPSNRDDEKTQLRNLVEELRMLAGLLEWRCREDKYETILKDLEAAAGGAYYANLSANVSRSGSVNGSGGGGKGKAKEREVEKEVERESTSGSVSTSSSGTR